MALLLVAILLEMGSFLFGYFTGKCSIYTDVLHFLTVFMEEIEEFGTHAREDKRALLKDSLVAGPWGVR